MAKVDGSLGSLVQGVSQQPARARLPGQSEEQINVVNDEVFGMSRRPSTEVLATFQPFDEETGVSRVEEHGTVKMQSVKMPYLMRVSDTDPALKLIEDGVEKQVQIEAVSAPYLRTNQGENLYGRRILFKEMNNTVFVLNTQTEVAMLPEVPAYSDLNATVVYCRGGQYAVGFTIRFEIGGVTDDHHVTFCTPDGSVVDDTEAGQVKYIVQQLYKLSTEAPTGAAATDPGASVTAPELVPADDSSWVPEEGKYYTSAGAYDAISNNFDVTMVGEYLVFSPKVSTLDYTITATETTGSELLVSVYDSVEDVGRLPNRAPVGHVVRIVGSNRSEDDYYMEWVVEGKAVNTINDVKGYWEECTAPDLPYKLDPATLPQQLYLDEADDTYKIKPIEWDERSAGNDGSNPVPKFVGKMIQDIADFQGRAVFLHDTSVSMSQSDEYFNWFKQTASTKLATDPIHLRSTATEGDSQMVYAVPFNRDLILIGTNNSQYMINGRNTLTTDNASITLTAEFDIDLQTRPQPLGDSVLFPSFTGKFAHAHEMYLEGNADSHARRTVTDHVPRYIEGRPSTFSASDGANTAVMVAEDKKTLYVYEYLWLDNSRVQSAWNKWKFSMDVVHARIDEGILYLTHRTDSGGFVLTKTLLYKEDAEGLDHTIHMDYTSTVELSDSNQVYVPYSGNADDLENITVVQLNGGNYVDGDVLPIQSVVDGTPPSSLVDYALVTLKVNVTGTVMTGSRFHTKLIPTMPYLRDGDGVAITGAEISISDFTMTFTDTGPFTMTRECVYENPEDYWSLRYSGRKLGDPQFVLGTAPVDSDKVDFPFEDQTTTSKLVLECDTHLPMTITEIEWRGNVRNRSKRLTNGG